MARKLTRKEKRRINKAKFRLQQRRRNLKRACVGKAKTKRGRARKARSPKCRYHKKRLPVNKRRLKRAYAKVRGRKRTSTRRKGRRTAARRNPGSVVKSLRGGGSLELHRTGGNQGLLYGHNARGELVLDRSGSYDSLFRLMRSIKTTAALNAKARKSEWDMLARDNPRRRRTRRNCGTMRNAPIKRGDLSALRRVIASHAKGRKRRTARAR
jgi:hypothetical protein